MNVQGIASRRTLLTLTIVALTALLVLVAFQSGSVPSAFADGDPAVEHNENQGNRRLRTEKNLTTSLALSGAKAALDSCTAGGYRVSVTVVDASGVTQVQLRGDGAGPHTIGSSDGKAYTAASLSRATLGLANFVGTRPDLEGLRDMDDRILILGGGLPIEIDGVVVGGIGVGGAPAGELDEECAQVGIDRILDRINRNNRSDSEDD